ncbi:hypothetical protein OROMI_008783 [Orobanche minor]
MALPDNPVHIQNSRHPVQTTAQALTEPHQILHIINIVAEERLQHIYKFADPCSQQVACKNLHKVPEVVRAVEGDPADGVVANPAESHHQLGELGRVDSGPPAPLEVDPLDRSITIKYSAWGSQSTLKSANLDCQLQSSPWILDPVDFRRRQRARRRSGPVLERRRSISRHVNVEVPRADLQALGGPTRPALSPLDHYRILKSNVDALKLIQLDVTLYEQLNFSDFDADHDPHAPDSIELLRSQWVDFERSWKPGVYSAWFAELMMGSGLVCNDAVSWVTFHSAYDFGHLVKILMRCQHGDEFMDVLKAFFGDNVYDVKYLIRFCESLYGIEWRELWIWTDLLGSATSLVRTVW